MPHRATERQKDGKRDKEGKERREIRGLPLGVIAFLTLGIDSPY